MIKKDLSPKGQSLRLTFELPADAAEESVSVVGDFNDWAAGADSMEFMPRNEIWRAKISVRPGERYEFRYLIDGETWRNEAEADDYVSNPYFEENSVVDGAVDR